MAKNNLIKLTEEQVLDLLHYARRYCDGRRTYIAHDFNVLYLEIAQQYPEILAADKTRGDITVRFFPFAQDGQYDHRTGLFDATSGLEEQLIKIEQNAKA